MGCELIRSAYCIKVYTCSSHRIKMERNLDMDLCIINTITDYFIYIIILRTNASPLGRHFSGSYYIGGSPKDFLRRLLERLM